MNALIILNPAAHSERARGACEKIRALPGAATQTTTGPGEARRIAAEAAAQGCRVVVAAGGDGTINDVVNGIAGTDVALGILPVGTMNVFAKELGLPPSIEKAWDVIREGHVREIDLIRANEQYCVQLAGVGLDAQVVEATSWDSKKSFGPLSYLISAAHIAARKPPRLIVENDGARHEGSFVLIGNGRYYGGPVAFFKEAQIDDGLLDVLIFKNLRYLDIARYLGTVLMGKHTALDDVEYFQAPRIHVTSDEDVPVEVDGEVCARLPVTFRISSRKLKVLVPGK
jgi:YegS/Rv2252/BmrU family lipid kinase